MEIIRQLWFVWAIWCILDKVYSAHILSVPKSVMPLPTTDFSECGKSKKVDQMSPKIVGGEEAKLGSWPWMVALFYKTRQTRPLVFHFECGGSLISRRWVITAAHCIPSDSDEMFVRLGDLDLDERVDDRASPVSVAVERTLIHPKYSAVTMANDIALIYLEKSVNFTENIRPICLLCGEEYKTEEYYDGTEAFITGWGRLGEDKNLSSHLLEASVEGIPLKTCIQQYRDHRLAKTINDTIICASGPGKDTCEYDSGGPLMFFNNTQKRFYLGGITSFGEECGSKNYAGVYTKVAKFIPWIKSIMDEGF